MLWIKSATYCQTPLQIDSIFHQNQNVFNLIILSIILPLTSFNTFCSILKLIFILGLAFLNQVCFFKFLLCSYTIFLLPSISGVLIMEKMTLYRCASDITQNSHTRAHTPTMSFLKLTEQANIPLAPSHPGQYHTSWDQLLSPESTETVWTSHSWC